MHSVDILMITYDRPGYTHKSLRRLLSTCDGDMRVWLWHNGTHMPTLEIARSFASHPSVAQFRHSPVNERLRAPTNWLWSNSDADFVAKVDDDCLVPPMWADVLRSAHQDNPEFGAVACWRFYEEDFVPELAGKKLHPFRGGHQLLQNFWVQGSGYLMKRQCILEHGLLEPDEGFTNYCIRLSLAGYINGWYFPFLHEDHMDDPRSPNTELRTDADFRRRPPLSAQLSGATSVVEWEEQLRRSARSLQRASIEARDYRGWRRQVRRARSLTSLAFRSSRRRFNL